MPSGLCGMCDALEEFEIGCGQLVDLYGGANWYDCCTPYLKQDDGAILVTPTGFLVHVCPPCYIDGEAGNQLKDIMQPLAVE